jgi:hypothetical protein
LPEINTELTEEQFIEKAVYVCANMKGGLSYSTLRSLPLREFNLVLEAANHVVEARNREAKSIG